MMQTMAAEDDVIRVDKAAPLLGVHRNQLYLWLKSDSPPPHWRTLGGVYQFSRQKLIEWRDAGAGQAKPEQPGECSA